MSQHRIGCDGKSAFTTFALAEAAARRRNHRGRAAANNPVEAYHCSHCHQYHTGEARAVVHRKVKRYRIGRDQRRVRGSPDAD